MYQKFIKKQDYKKIYLFYHLLSKNKSSIDELIVKLDVSQFTLKRYITELKIHLKELQLDNSITINRNGSFYICTKIGSSNDWMHIFAKLKLLYLERSPIFKVFDLLFTSNTCNINDICHFLFISENHAYKIIKQFNKNLSSFSISIKKSKTDKSFSIVGKETNIRYIYLVLYVNAYQSTNWPFTLLSHSELKRTYPKSVHEGLNSRSYSVQIRIEYLLAIIDTRLRKSHYVDAFPKDIQLVLKVFMNQYDVTDMYSSFPPSFSISHYTKSKNDEIEYYNLIVRIIDSTTDTVIDKVNIGKQLSYMKNPITQFYTVFLSSLFEKYQVPDEPELVFTCIYFSVLYHCYSICHTFNPIEGIYIYQSSEKQPKTIKKNVMINTLQDAFSNSNIPSILVNEDTVNLVASALTHCLPPINNEILYIYVQYAKEPIGHKIITNAITDTYSSHSIKIVSDIREATLIISDTIEKISTVEFLFFENIFLNSSWEELFSFLTKKIVRTFLNS